MVAPLSQLVDRWTPPLLSKLTADGRVVVPPPARAYFLAGLAARSDGPILALVPGERDAEELADDLELFTDRVAFLPAWETLPFEHVSPNVATMAHRVEARHLLAQPEPVVVVASVRAATQRISPSSTDPLTFRSGASVDFEEATIALVNRGYHRVDRVESRGEFAVRGGIIDVFPAGREEPARIEFWGDDIDSIRLFSPSTQRSHDTLDEVAVVPAREFRCDEGIRERATRLLDTDAWASATWDRIAEGVSFSGMESWMPWLAEPRTILDDTEATVVIFDPVRSLDRSRDLLKEEFELAAALAPTWGQGAPEAGDHPALYLALEEAVGTRSILQAPPLAAGPADLRLEVRSLDAPPGDAEGVAQAIAALLGRGVSVTIAMDGAHAADRVAKRLAESGVDLPRRERLNGGPSAVLASGIHHGFHMPELSVAVFGEQQIAGRRRSHRRARERRTGDVGVGYQDLVPGDYVVHHRHGIGHFEGLVTRTIAGIERDYLVVGYAGEDKLYVPTDQLAAVKKYQGGEAPRISRMGGADWARTKGKVRKAVAAVAEEVVSLHRRRAAARGHAYSPDSPWQREMESAFPFEETPDQLSAIEDVKRDMEDEKPMERLVFGDVGFGKTEVAIRAAFKAVADGRQVAILCPTTLLAQQHHQTFSERFEAYPLRVEMLSRFLTPAEQRGVVEGLGSGEVDVVIATHRVLSESVRFKNLGLVVVDEEQRFGVGAKDRLKQLKVGVDVLTLTATPIPRTLEMALTGVREVSHIRTPPVDRHPILTYVGPYDESSVSAAIRREMLREGQVFYVHNRVQSIDRAVARLRQLVPNARYAVAHGQMSEAQLEQVMLDFWSREYDVLVATTIIESGLDLPQVNTLIVERADLLGLAQLYQLRGRVGRSDQRAYAYLFHPTDQSLSETAYRRLEAVGEHSDLGSGFNLAMRDLEIRGAGSMLGEVQSGQIASVGFDLYCQLVAEAVGELEGLPVREESDVVEIRIDLPVDAHLPAAYVEDQQARIEAYRRLAAAATAREVEEVAVEWADRYGPVPPAAAALLEMARLRAEALRVGLTEIVKLRDEVRLGPVDLAPSQEVRLERLVKGSVLRADEGLIFLPAPAEDEIVAKLLGFLGAMWPVDS